MRPISVALGESRGPLIEGYDAALLDLDGVLYVGPTAVPGAAETVTAVQRAGRRIGYVTNNASRSAHSVVDHLARIGITAEPRDVITSAQTAARYLADLLPAGSPILVVGSESLRAAVLGVGLRCVDDASGEPHAVVQGLAQSVGWRELAEAAIAIGRGCHWVATNADASLPSARGPVPGNGALVRALEVATGQAPVVVGKPHPAMHREAIERVGSTRAVVVGDRLDTDIAGANAAGCDSLLVLSGVTRAPDLIDAPAGQRPTYVAANVRGLVLAHPRAAAVRGGTRCGAWHAHRGGPVLSLSRLADRAGVVAPETLDDDLDALRALCCSAWSGNGPVGEIRGLDGHSTRVLGRLGLDS